MSVTQVFIESGLLMVVSRSEYSIQTYVRLTILVCSIVHFANAPSGHGVLISTNTESPRHEMITPIIATQQLHTLAPLIRQCKLQCKADRKGICSGPVRLFLLLFYLL